MKLECKLNFYQMVYLIHDPEQTPRMVTEVIFSPNGVLYTLTLCGLDTKHFEGEISTEKDELKRLI